MAGLISVVGAITKKPTTINKIRLLTKPIFQSRTTRRFMPKVMTKAAARKTMTTQYGYW